MQAVDGSWSRTLDQLKSRTLLTPFNSELLSLIGNILAYTQMLKCYFYLSCQ